ncbi:hypothetical protein LCGC14_3033700, partial [marine sediment metagenome]
MTSPCMPKTTRGFIRACRLLAVAWCLPVLSGCDGAHETTVWGNVTLDDKPLKLGTVTFHPQGSGQLAYGTINDKG